MRRVLVPVMVAVGLAGAATGSAYAQDPSPGAGAAPATPGEPVCTIDDSRLRELSGMVATANGYVVVNDSSEVSSRERVFLLNRKCNVREAVQYGGNGPRDPEDLALSPDKKFVWIADIGDNDTSRETVALWRMPVDGSDTPEIFRLSYPDGAKDAEAILIGPDGLPIIITKGAKALLYKSSAAPKKGTTTPLQKVGELTLPKTTTGNPLGPAGRVTVTGAAAAPDGSRVALRTYADAFEWDVSGGDIVAALTSGTPRITPLPDEPWGEAISYTVDGVAFLTVSETAQQEGLDAEILRYSPAKAAPPPAAGAKGGGAGAEDTRSFLDKLDLGDITMLIGAVGVLGVLLVAAGVIGIVRARRRAPELDELDDDVPARGAAQVAGPATEILARPRPGVDPPYGRAGVGADGVYGAARPTGPVYGGAPAGGAVYGGNRSGGYDDGGVGGERDGGAVYGAGYRSGRDVEAHPAQYGGGGYGGGGYGGRESYGGYPDDRYADNGYAEEAHGANGYRGNGYSDDGYAQQPAGGQRRDARGYGYDEPY